MRGRGDRERLLAGRARGALELFDGREVAAAAEAASLAMLAGLLGRDASDALEAGGFGRRRLLLRVCMLTLG